jgi:hypothetical protein
VRNLTNIIKSETAFWVRPAEAEMQSWLNRKFLKVLIPVMLVFVLASAAGTVKAQDAQWHTRFWNNTTFGGDPVHERNDNTIDFDWGDGSPFHHVNSDNFSAKWRRKVTSAHSDESAVRGSCHRRTSAGTGCGT